jgi:hypothetical protein
MALMRRTDYSDRDGFEDVKTIESSTNHGSRDLRVPMNLLNILLTLMNEEQLRWDGLFVRTAGPIGRLIIILLDRKIPERHLVVRTGCRKDGIFGWVPFNRRDRGSMPVERSHWCRI